MEQLRGVDTTRVGSAVGGYQLLAVVGSGGMGTVYRALDADGREVALKLLHPGFGADAAARARLRREVATLHRVRGDYVARVLDAEVDADEAFVVTELIAGQALDSSIGEHGPMNSQELRNLGGGLAAALEQIHAVNVLHRDLKPGNIMLTDSGPVVIDFGISQLADDARLTQVGLVTGTPGYVDPVVLAGAGPSVSGDWWGWAAVLLFAATGRPPFGSGPMMAVLSRVEGGRPDTEGLPPLIAQVFRRALHPDPALRLGHESVIRAFDDNLHGREATEAIAASPGVTAPGPAGMGRAPGIPAHQGPGVVTDSVSPGGVQPGLTRPPDAPPMAPTPSHRSTAPVAAGQQWPPWAVPAQPRPWLNGSWWVAIISLGILWPGLVLLLMVSALVVAGTVGASVRGLRNRRLRVGVRRSDTLTSALMVPVHLLLSVLLTVPGAAVGILGGGIVWGLLSASATPWAVVGIGLVLVTQLMWWTPSSQTAREGTWAIWQRLAPTRALAGIWMLVAFAAAAMCAYILGWLAPEPTWAPLPVPPIPSFLT
ncbi:MAG: protein kinase domain-containing protein [Beutenbergiaceae bacterium]